MKYEFTHDLYPRISLIPLRQARLILADDLSTFSTDAPRLVRYDCDERKLTPIKLKIKRCIHFREFSEHQ